VRIIDRLWQHDGAATIAAADLAAAAGEKLTGGDGSHVSINNVLVALSKCAKVEVKSRSGR
jgi:hypothetical protein